MLHFGFLQDSPGRPLALLMAEGDAVEGDAVEGGAVECGRCHGERCSCGDRRGVGLSQTLIVPAKCLRPGKGRKTVTV